ncbi:MAG: hypothetical protein B1H11_00820 [Desulfobacteraceae bacterium 4484_190.1]|nr:MAG: hypothetical protein B1H11_00820 [Desulfobacteraceae bacterium 4484_190.1]
MAEKWQRHPAADLRGYKPLLQFTIFSSNKSVNYFYLKMKDAKILLYFSTVNCEPVTVNSYVIFE